MDMLKQYQIILKDCYRSMIDNITNPKEYKCCNSIWKEPFPSLCLCEECGNVFLPNCSLTVYSHEKYDEEQLYADIYKMITERADNTDTVSIDEAMKGFKLNKRI